jgi:DNA-binding transcriptional LysR family regulator
MIAVPIGPRRQRFAATAPPYLNARGALEPVVEPWWPGFSGPFLYYPGRRYLPSPLRAFVDCIKAG